MESLSILCVGGRGQPILAGGGDGAQKSANKKKVGLLWYISSTKYFKFVDKKMREVKMKKKKSAKLTLQRRRAYAVLSI